VAKQITPRLGMKLKQLINFRSEVSGIQWRKNDERQIIRFQLEPLASHGVDGPNVAARFTEPE
jgi:hypothetical protein